MVFLPLSVDRARCSHGPVGRAGLNAAPSGAANSPECTAVRILVRAMTHVGHGPQARGYSAAICIGSRPHNGSAPLGLVAFWSCFRWLAPPANPNPAAESGKMPDFLHNAFAQ